MRPTITGVERWARELAAALLALDGAAYRTAVPRPGARGRLTGQAWEQLGLPLRARSVGARLILSPANLAPVAWPGNVLVLHDAAALREPGAYSAAYRAWHGVAEFTAARRARAVITVSEFSRGELVSMGGIAPERIHVIPGGVSPHFGAPPADPVASERLRAADRAARTRLGVPPRYVLTVASADARKNLDALAPVAAALAERGIALVWAGEARGYFARVDPVPGLQVLGWVADADLPALYRGADAFVLPSRYEGFGLTCVEAMACGTPVVAADRAALPETCGGAARLADPDDPRALRAAVLAVTDGPPEQRAALRAAGSRRAADFTWAASAAAVDRLLRTL